MTYFGFLLRFLVIPLLVLLGLTIWDGRQGKLIPGFQVGWTLWRIIGVHVALALVYTTPWDNYLVATGVWYYNPALVSGIVFGYVPLEEYTFFVLETLLAGLWWSFLARRLSLPTRFAGSFEKRLTALIGLVLLWLLAVTVLFSGWRPGTYLALILVWALPAIAPQLLFGADILWHYRRLIFFTVVPLTLYLSATDALAIASGTWTIDPAQSTGVFLGALPLEEAVFFLVTNILIGFGLTLMLARHSQLRLDDWRGRSFKGLP